MNKKLKIALVLAAIIAVVVLIQIFNNGEYFFK